MKTILIKTASATPKFEAAIKKSKGEPTMPNCWTMEVDDHADLGGIETALKSHLPDHAKLEVIDMSV